MMSGKNKIYNERYTFEKFVIGECNRKAFECAKDIVGGQNKESLFVFYGPMGYGKEHLASAIEYEWEKKYPDATIISENTARLHLEYPLTGSVEDEVFVERIINADLLILKNLHYIFAELNHRYALLDYVLENRQRVGKITIITTAKPWYGFYTMKQIRVVELKHLDNETARNIILQMIEEYNLKSEQFDEEGIQQLIREANENPRILIGYFNRLFLELKVGRIKKLNLESVQYVFRKKIIRSILGYTSLVALNGDTILYYIYMYGDYGNVIKQNDPLRHFHQELIRIPTKEELYDCKLAMREYSNRQLCELYGGNNVTSIDEYLAEFRRWYMKEVEERLEKWFEDMRLILEVVSFLNEPY